MANRQAIESDERTELVEKSSYGLGYKLLAFGLLIDVAYRSFRLGETAWDLLALVVLSGAAMALYQHQHRILGRRWMRLTALAIGAGAVVAVLLVTVFKP